MRFGRQWGCKRAGGTFYEGVKHVDFMKKGILIKMRKEDGNGKFDSVI